jgi:hypothetical protein
MWNEWRQTAQNGNATRTKIKILCEGSEHSGNIKWGWT